MEHTINEKELDEWLCRPQWQMFASSGSQEGVKRLEVDTAGNCHVFRVTLNGDTLFLGADKTLAVATYNKATR